MQVGAAGARVSASSSTARLPSGRPDAGHPMFDPRVRRGPTVVNAPAQAAKNAASASREAADARSADAGDWRAMRAGDPVKRLAATISLPPQLFRLDASCGLEVTARQRGPQAHHIRAGVRPRQEIDLSSFLEEGGPAKAAASVVASSQTDAMLPAPAPAPYAPPKSGVDAATQIEHGTAEWIPRLPPHERPQLFDFDGDHSISALVDSLSDRILAQAGEEDGHEAALVALAGRREVMEGVLAADAARERELEAQAKARAAAQAKTLAAAHARAAREAGASEKVAARALAKAMWAEGGGMERVRRAGGFVDPTAQAMRDGVLPGLLAGVAARLDAGRASSEAAAGLLEGAVAAAAAIYGARVRAEAEAREAAEAAARKQHSIRVTVRLARRAEDVAGPAGQIPAGAVAPGDVEVDATDETVVEGGEGEGAGAGAGAAGAGAGAAGSRQSYTLLGVGPVPVARGDTVAAVEGRIWEWVQSTRSRHCRRMAAMAGGVALVLCLGGGRLPPASLLLDVPEEEVAARGGLALRPAAAFPAAAAEEGAAPPPADGWVLDVPEEVFEVVAPAAAAEAEA